MGEGPRDVVVIGLDGATFTVLKDLIDTPGRVEHLTDLYESGAHGTLESTMPPSTMPAWPSFMTGVNPGKHGVFGFLKHGPEGNRRVVTGNDIAGTPFWTSLGEAGFPAIVVNVPGTYPPVRLNGHLVTGMLTPEDADYTYPTGLAGELDDVVGGYRINTDASLLESGDVDPILGDLRDVTRRQTEAFTHLLETRTWAFGMVMFRATDVAQHELWTQREAIEDLYDYIDTCIGDILAIVDDPTVFVVSDHGFGRIERKLYLNDWLRGQGYLGVKRAPGDPDAEQNGMSDLDGFGSTRPWYARSLGRVGISKETVKRILPATGIDALKRLLPADFRRSLPESSYEIDWEATSAYYPATFGSTSKLLSVNVEGRDSSSGVSPDDREAVIDEVVGDLSNLSHRDTDEPIVKAVYRREELYDGQFVDELPDVVLEFRPEYTVGGDFYARSTVVDLDSVRGSHRRDGVLIASGPGIRSTPESGTYSIMAVAPTILHHFGCPVPADADGEPLSSIYERGSRVQDVEPDRIEIGRDRATGTGRGEGAEIEDRLRGLGYLE
jgi:predicted AlkP superfamily phosphohydrolase/phosphomutase